MRSIDSIVKQRLRLLSVIAVLLSAACTEVKPTWRDYVDDLTHVLRDSVGGASLPQVAVIRDSTHLWIRFGGIEYQRLSDSAFAVRAVAAAQIAMRRYRQRAVVESVTVSTVRPIRAGVEKRLLDTTFAASMLAGNR